MSVKLAIAGGEPFDVHDEVITLGSDPSCTVKFPVSPEIKPKHAVIRSIAGRWLIEVREGDSIFVGGPEPRRLQWLNPGDQIRLFEQCPVVVFQPSEVIVTIFSDTDRSPPPLKPVPKPAKPPSSGSIPVRIPPSSGTIPVSVSGFQASTDEAANSRPASTPIRSAQQTAVDQTTSEMPVGPAPILQRLPSGGDDASEDRALTPEQQEFRWVMIVIGRAVAAGLVLLLIWLMISWISKAFTPESINSVPATDEIRIG